MKKIALLLAVMLVTLVSCHTGPLKDIRIGKNFGIYAKNKILVHRAPSKDAETFYIETPQAFFVEDFICEEGVGTLSCYSDLMIAKDYPEVVKVAYYKVSFEFGGEGYINAKYFYPELNDYIVSEDLAERMGTTPSGLGKRAREEYALNKIKVKKVYELAEEALRNAEEIRTEIIAGRTWPEDEKELVRNHDVWIGMDEDQLFLSQYGADKIDVSITAEGKFTTWYYSDSETRYYLKNGILTKSKTTLDSKAPRRTKEEIIDARIRKIMKIDETIREALELDE